MDYDKPKPCYCDAYLNKRTGKPFPHRLGGGKCCEVYNKPATIAVGYHNDYFARMKEFGLKEKEFG